MSRTIAIEVGIDISPAQFGSTNAPSARAQWGVCIRFFILFIFYFYYLFTYYLIIN
jgi:hypothetical protein